MRIVLSLLKNTHESLRGRTRPHTDGEGARRSVMSWIRQVLPGKSLHEILDAPRSWIGKEKRQQEFRLGRSIAESQLHQLGLNQPKDSIGVNDDRSPNWPAGFLGSISHSNHWIWISTAKSQDLESIGIDTEIIVDEASRLQIQDEIASPQEWSLLQSLNTTAEQTFTLVFSAKEAFYKCIYPRNRTYFGFRDAEVIAADQHSVRIRKISPEANTTELDVVYHFEGNSVFTAAWIESQETA